MTTDPVYRLASVARVYGKDNTANDPPFSG
jgi:hypothetical protein